MTSEGPILIRAGIRCPCSCFATTLVNGKPFCEPCHLAAMEELDLVQLNGNQNATAKKGPVRSPGRSRLKRDAKINVETGLRFPGNLRLKHL